jgi:hypothetical protein
MASWMDYFSNPRGHFVKKTMFDVLQERYAQNEQIIERLSIALQTEDDLKAFFKMVGDIYEIGYLKSVNDHKEQLQKAGLIARVVTGNSDIK